MKQPSNVLFLFVDQWPNGSFSFQGSPCQTPVVDSLASRSTVFTNAFTTCPLCTPARGALLTGRWPHESGVYDNCGVGYSNQRPLPADTPTWLDHAKQAGYRVGYYGKWHLGADGLEDRGLDGFNAAGEMSTPYDDRPGFSYENTEAFYEKQGKEILKRGTAPFWGEAKAELGESKCDKAVSAGLSFLKKHQVSEDDRPFFLTVSIADPHFPHYLPSSVLARREALDLPYPPNFEDDFTGKPAFQNGHWWPCHDTTNLTPEDWKHIFDYALRHREYVDSKIGEVLDHLEQSGLADDTLVVFTSDHGDMCGAHNRFDKGPYFYDEVWRVPLMISTPGMPAAKNAEFASLIDLGRYFNRHFGATQEPTDGLDLNAELGVNKELPVNSRHAYGVYDMYNGHWFGIRAIRDEHFKYVRNYQAMDEFYDLRDDPQEMTNAIDHDSLKPEVARLSRRLDQFLQDIDDPINQVADLPQPGEVVHKTPYASGVAD